MESNKRKTERKNRKLKKAAALVNLVRGNIEQQKEFKTINGMEEGTGATQKDEYANARGETRNGKSGLLYMNQIIAKYVTNNPVVDQSQMDALKAAKEIKAEKRRQMLQSPQIILTPDEMLPFQPASDDNLKYQLPLYPMDVQQLLLFALNGSFCRFHPRWCKLKRPGRVSSVVVVTLDGLGYSDFTNDKQSFPFLAESFDSLHLEMVSPEQYGSTVDGEIYSVPMSVTQIKKNNVKVAAGDKEKIAAKMKAGKKPLSDKGQSNGSSDKFSRSCLLLSSHQMMQEGYPMPVQTENNMYEDYVFTKDEYTAVTADSPLYGLDCEMCVTSARKNELTRVSVVDENGQTVYDSLVKPYNRIVNYVTRYSGITPQMMEDVTVRLENVQAVIRDILPSDAILCGQSLNFDLIALKMFHPYVIDTSVVFNMSGNRRCKAGLRKLAGFFLNRSIQDSSSGHSSVEDATASLDLVKLKLKKGLEFGDATISGTYFPNIETYFLGEDGGKDDGSAVENVEVTPDNPQGSLKRGLPPDPEEPHSNAKTLKMSKANSPSKTYHAGQRKTMFSQNNSVHVSKSFFQLVDEAGRSSCIIGNNLFTSKYEGDPVRKVTVTSDKEAYQSAKTALEKTEFVWVHFDKYRRVMADPDRTQEEMRDAKLRLDDRVKKVVTNAKEKSLVVVMMTGRWGVNAGTFVKVKIPAS